VDERNGQVKTEQNRRTYRNQQEPTRGRVAGLALGLREGGTTKNVWNHTAMGDGQNCNTLDREHERGEEQHKEKITLWETWEQHPNGPPSGR